MISADFLRSELNLALAHWIVDAAEGFAREREEGEMLADAPEREPSAPTSGPAYPS